MFSSRLHLVCELLCPQSSLDSGGFMFSSRLHLVGSTFSCTPENAGPGAGQQSPRSQNIVEPVPGSLEVGTLEVRIKLPVHLVQCRQEEKAHVAHFTTVWKFWLLGKKKARLNKRLVCFQSRLLSHHPSTIRKRAATTKLMPHLIS